MKRERILLIAKLKVRGRSFNLSDAYMNVSETGFSETGNALYADWSPDGTTITFIADVDAIGRRGIDRIQQLSTLCLLDTTKLQTSCPLDGLDSPFRPRWSPGGEYIAFSGQYAALQHQGLWIFDVRTNRLHLVAEGRFQDHIWTPDGTALVGVRLANPEDLDSGQVWTYTLPQWLVREH